nr:reverse transcriptase domain-containing protein [Tanacetum cinerariifolium]
MDRRSKMAFKGMKQLIAKLPMLTAPKEKKELIMYLAAVKEAISAVLMTERDGKQVPIYSVSRALQGPEINYTPMEKLILALDGTPIKDREELLDPWILFMDGSSCIDGSRAGLIITNLKGMEFTYALRFRFNATNNEAEYEALIVGLWIARQIGVQNLQANVDSKLVANLSQIVTFNDRDVMATNLLIGFKTALLDSLSKSNSRYRHTTRI